MVSETSVLSYTVYQVYGVSVCAGVILFIFHGVSHIFYSRFFKNLSLGYVGNAGDETICSHWGRGPIFKKEVFGQGSSDCDLSLVFFGK